MKPLKKVDLGPHAEPIRLVLLGTQAFSTLQSYPIFSYVLRDPDSGSPARWLVTTPVRNRMQNRWNYQLALLGCAWIVFTGRSAPPLPPSCQLRENGTFIMPIIDYSAHPLVRHLIKT